MPKRAAHEIAEEKVKPLDTLNLHFKLANGNACANMKLTKIAGMKFQVTMTSLSTFSLHESALSSFDGCVFEIACVEAFLHKMAQIADSTPMRDESCQIHLAFSKIEEQRVQHRSVRPEEVFGSVDQWFNRMIVNAEYQDTPLTWTPMSRDVCQQVADFFAADFEKPCIDKKMS